jgi:autotransporter-associated beta strand protein
MKVVVLFAAASSLFLGGLRPLTAATVTLQQLLSGNSITVDDLTFSNFASYSSLGLNGASQIDPASITVAPAAGTEPGLFFQSTALGVNLATSVQTVNFQFDVTSSTGPISGADLSYSASASGNGSAGIFESVTNTSGLNVSIPPGILTAHSDLTAPLTSVHITEGLNMNVSAGSGTAAISNFTSSFSQIAPTAPTYIITTILSPDPNNQKVDANGISPTGVVVGDYYDAGGTLRAYIFNPQTNVYTKYGYPGGFPTALNGLNDSGQLVGAYVTSSSNFGFLVSNGVAQPIAPFMANQSLANSINKSGQIVGSFRTLGQQTKGYVGDPIHGYLTLQSPAQAQTTVANGLNDAGEVVGNYQDTTGIQHGFFATKPNYVVTSLDYPGANFTIAQGINSSGTIAGVFSFDGGSTTHGFLDTNGVFTQFDVPGSKPGSTFVGSINDAGQLVGSYVPMGGTQLVGFVATPAVSTWTGTTSTNWSDIGNWSGAVSGATIGTTNAATALFTQNAPNSPLTIDAGRNLQNITFDTAAVNSLTIGIAGGQPLLLTAGGTIQITSTVTKPQTVNAPLVLEGDYTLSSGASSNLATLNLGGGITPGATSGITTLTLNGVNTGANTISGVVADNGSGQLAVSMNGTGAWILSGTNTYSGGTTVTSGTLTTTTTGSIGSGPLIVSAADTINSTLNLGASQTVSSLSGTVAGSGSARVNIAGGTTFTVSQSGNTTFAGTLVNSGTVAKMDVGTLEFNGAPALNSNCSLQANSGTLRFNVNSGAATIGTGVIATVASGATLELAGSVSALGVSGGNRVSIINNSQQSSGGMLLVSGTNQHVGGIDGTGDTVINDGSDLTADHIVQNALVIGATGNSPALVTIDASDTAGNPLDQTRGLALAGTLSSSSPLGADGITSINLSSGRPADLGVPTFGDYVGRVNPSSVPEPSTLLLVLLAVLGVICTQYMCHHFRCQTV